MGPREEVDEVTIGIAKEHGAVSPWLRDWIQHETIDNRIQASPFGINVRHLEIQNHGPIVPRHGAARCVDIRCTLTANRQDNARHVKLDVLFAPDRWTIEHSLVESTEARDVGRDDARASQLGLRHIFMIAEAIKL
jgi:hypothetical protein